jgi:tetrahydrodipicolinate N-succinyltransferase
MAKPNGKKSQTIRVDKEFKQWLDHVHSQLSNAGLTENLPQTSKIIARKLKHMKTIKSIKVDFEYETRKKKQRGYFRI